MSSATDPTDGAEYRVRCTVCNHTPLAVSKVHAHAVGRRHYHAEGHPVGCDRSYLDAAKAHDPESIDEVVSS